ncbi:MAG: hypothetical protein HQ557_00480 [Bacteroidetes bacterium]|nr:hypothetical protein [Bacteroidota bacterium]
MAKSIAINLKIRAINEYFDPEGDGLYAIAKRYGVSHVSVLNWIHDMDRLFRQCKENVLALGNFVVLEKTTRIYMIKSLTLLHDATRSFYSLL